jgi:hypothetical protein
MNTAHSVLRKTNDLFFSSVEVVVKTSLPAAGRGKVYRGFFLCFFLAKRGREECLISWFSAPWLGASDFS